MNYFIRIFKQFNFFYPETTFRHQRKNNNHKNPERQ